MKRIANQEGVVAGRLMKIFVYLRSKRRHDCFLNLSSTQTT